MRVDEKRLRMRVFVKTFLYLKGGKWTAKELAEHMNACGVGIKMGVNPNELARDLFKVIQRNKTTNGFMKGLSYEKTTTGRGGVYYLEKRGDC